MKKPKKKIEPMRIVGTTDKAVVVMDNVELFTLEFLKNGGNVFEAAKKIGNYKNDNTARAAGSRFLSQAKQRGLIRSALEQRGYNYGRLIDIALQKMETAKKPDWWDRIMKMADYEDFMSSQKPAGDINIQTQNIFAAHRKLSEQYVEADEGEIVEGETVENEDRL